MTGPAVKRYSVRVEREVIVYAPSSRAAKAKAVRYVAGPAAREVKVLGVKRLPMVEMHRGPEVDVAPARETR